MAPGMITRFPIEKEYAKNPQITPADIKALREWIDRQPHLPSSTLTDLDLLVTFHCCDQSAEVAKQVLDLHFTLRTLFTPFFLNRDVDRKVEHSLHTVLFAPLEMPTVHDYRAIYIRLLDTDPKNFIFADILRCFLMIFDLWQLEEGTWPGFVIMIDMNTVQYGHLARLDLMSIRSILYFLQGFFNFSLLSPLMTPTVNKYRAIYCRLLDPDPRNFNLNDVVKCFMMVFDLWQQEEGTWPGFVLMIDMDKTVIGHLARLELMSIRQILYFLQEAMLVRLKEVHFLNAPSFMDKLMMMLKPFMKKELLEMIHIHQIGSDSIYKFVPKEAFPKDFGGEYKGYNTLRDEIWERVQANRQYFKDENKNRVNESLRPGKPQTIDELFGIQGSFKKLDID